MQAIRKVTVWATVLSLAMPWQLWAEDWFDPPHCAICSQMANEPGLLEHITWETHVIPCGMLTLAVVPPEYMGKMRQAQKRMKQVSAQLRSGKQKALCGFCSSFGMLVRSGATPSQYESAAGYVGLLTSCDPEITKMIHAHAERTIKETAQQQ